MKEIKGKEIEKFLKDRFPDWEEGISIFDLPIRSKYDDKQIIIKNN